MEDEDDFKNVVAFPYVGAFAEYMKSRFNLEVTNATAQYNNRQINAVGDSESILQWIEPYKESILREARTERKRLNIVFARSPRISANVREHLRHKRQVKI